MRYHMRIRREEEEEHIEMMKEKREEARRLQIGEAIEKQGRKGNPNPIRNTQIRSLGLRRVKKIANNGTTSEIRNRGDSKSDNKYSNQKSRFEKSQEDCR